MNADPLAHLVAAAGRRRTNARSGPVPAPNTNPILAPPQPIPIRRADPADGDYYPTPPWATFALLEMEAFDGPILEPACGQGHTSEALAARGHVVHSSDLFDRGYGSPGVDFLSVAGTSSDVVDNVITNPPFYGDMPVRFARRANRIARKKVALFMRLAALEGKNRYDALWRSLPPSRVWVFSCRVTLVRDRVLHPGETLAAQRDDAGKKKTTSGVTPYAWYVWDKTTTDIMRFGIIPPDICRSPTLFDASKRITRDIEARIDLQARSRV